MAKIDPYIPLIKRTIICFGVLLLTTIFLFQTTSMFTAMLFTNRLDETQAIAFKCRFNALPFQFVDVISNVTGEKIAVLNVTFNAQTHYLYSEDFGSDETKNVGVLEKDGETFLVLWSSEVKDEKDYVIYGKFVNFYKWGTREQTSALVVEDYHEFGALDEIVSKNRFLFSQVTVGLVVLTTACILALVGTIGWFIDEMDTIGRKDRQKEN